MTTFYPLVFCLQIRTYNTYSTHINSFIHNNSEQSFLVRLEVFFGTNSSPCKINVTTQQIKIPLCAHGMDLGSLPWVQEPLWGSRWKSVSYNVYVTSEWFAVALYSNRFVTWLFEKNLTDHTTPADRKGSGFLRQGEWGVGEAAWVKTAASGIKSSSQRYQLGKSEREIMTLLHFLKKKNKTWNCSLLVPFKL